MGENKNNRMIPISVKGIPMFDFFYKEKDLDEVLRFEPRDGDIFLLTYPKCGTTWMQYVLWEILHRGKEPPKMITEVMLKQFPFLEMTGPSVLYTLTEPRVFKTHMPWQFVPHSPKAKYIIVVRNPFDCCISYFYHQRDVEGIHDLTFEEYFEGFVEGQIPYGNFFDSVLSYYSHKDDDNVLWINFEDMKKDIKTIILKVADFLGPEHKAALEDEAIMQNVLKYVSFDYMKGNLAFIGPKEPPKSREEYYEAINAQDPENTMKLNFIREGKIGNKDVLTEQHKEILITLMDDKLKGTAMEDYWREYV